MGLPRACLHGHLKASASPRQGFVSAVHCSIPLAWDGAWHTVGPQSVLMNSHIPLLGGLCTCACGGAGIMEG